MWIICGKFVDRSEQAYLSEGLLVAGSSNSSAHSAIDRQWTTLEGHGLGLLYKSNGRETLFPLAQKHTCF